MYADRRVPHVDQEVVDRRTLMRYEIISAKPVTHRGRTPKTVDEDIDLGLGMSEPTYVGLRMYFGLVRGLAMLHATYIQFLGLSPCRIVLSPFVTWRSEDEANFAWA